MSQPFVPAKFFLKKLGRTLQGHDDLVVSIRTREGVAPLGSRGEGPIVWRNDNQKKPFDLYVRKQSENRKSTHCVGSSLITWGKSALPWRYFRQWFVFMRNESGWVILKPTDEFKPIFALALKGNLTLRIQWELSLIPEGPSRSRALSLAKELLNKSIPPLPSLPEKPGIPLALAKSNIQSSTHHKNVNQTSGGCIGEPHLKVNHSSSELKRSLEMNVLTPKTLNPMASRSLSPRFKKQCLLKTHQKQHF